MPIRIVRHDGHIVGCISQAYNGDWQYKVRQHMGWHGRYATPIAASKACVRRAREVAKYWQEVFN